MPRLSVIFYNAGIMAEISVILYNIWGHRAGLGVWCELSGEAVGLAGTLSQ